MEMNGVDVHLGYVIAVLVPQHVRRAETVQANHPITGWSVPDAITSRISTDIEYSDC